MRWRAARTRSAPDRPDTNGPVFYVKDWFLSVNQR